MLSALRLLTLATAAALLSVATPAQVVRCTDARSGTVTYTDGNCAAGSRAHEVQARQSAQDIAQERAQAAQALEQKQQRLQAEAAALQLQAQRQALREREQPVRAAPAQSPAQDYARSPECARSRRQWDLTASSTRQRYDQDARVQAAQRQMELDCLGPQGYAEVEKNRPAAPPERIYAPVPWPARRPVYPRPPHFEPPRPEPRFTHCNVFRCYDRQGRSYTRP